MEDYGPVWLRSSTEVNQDEDCMTKDEELAWEEYCNEMNAQYWETEMADLSFYDAFND